MNFSLIDDNKRTDFIFKCIFYTFISLLYTFGEWRGMVMKTAVSWEVATVGKTWICHWQLLGVILTVNIKKAETNTTPSRDRTLIKMYADTATSSSSPAVIEPTVVFLQHAYKSIKYIISIVYLFSRDHWDIDSCRWKKRRDDRYYTYLTRVFAGGRVMQ